MDSLERTSVLLATGNEGKVRELKEITAHLPLKIFCLSDLGLLGDAPETGATFQSNAIQKAKYYFSRAGMPVFADDSGLEVDALGGEPGIHSARYGGFETHAERRKYLLEQLSDVPKAMRTARFQCAAVYFNGQSVYAATGCVEGFIGFEEQGTGGFGYDPLFSRTWDGPTYAEVTQAEKNTSSHRARAFQKLFDIIGMHINSEG